MQLPLFLVVFSGDINPVFQRLHKKHQAALTVNLDDH